MAEETDNLEGYKASLQSVSDYLKGLHGFHTSLGGNLEELDSFTESFFKHSIEPTAEDVARSWMSIYSEVKMTFDKLDDKVSGLLDEVKVKFTSVNLECDQLDKERHSIIDQYMDFRFRDMLTDEDMRKIDSIYAIPGTWGKAYLRGVQDDTELHRLTEELKAKDKECEELKAKIASYESCLGSIKEAMGELSAANRHTSASKSLIHHFIPPLDGFLAPAGLICGGKLPVEIIQQQAFVRVNQSLGKIVAQLVLTVKNGDETKPIVVESPVLSAPIPDASQGGHVQMQIEGAPPCPLPPPPNFLPVEDKPKPKPILTGGQLDRHERVCNEIVTTLEDWRKECYANFVKNNGLNTVREPSAHEIFQRIEARHVGEDDWKPIAERTLLRHLALALGAPIDMAKRIAATGGNGKYERTSKEALKTARKFPTYGRADVCVYWAALSLANVEFTKENPKRILEIVSDIQNDFTFARAVRTVPRAWP